MLGLDARLILGGQVVELAQGRQLGKIAQVEDAQELRRGAVEHGPAHLFLLADDAHKPAVEQGLEHRAAVHTANVVDLGACDGLAVGHNGQGFQHGARQAHRPPHQQLGNPRRVFRIGTQMPARGQGRHFDARALASLGQRLQRGRDLLAIAFAEQALELREPQRLVRGKKHAFQNRFQPGLRDDFNAFITLGRRQFACLRLRSGGRGIDCFV